ncbi:unnamed protein product [Adineta steineri]|uniref:Uncharacterized protein n=1 Tax=Adineta steineri TaxID=433720 RepID=A0A818JY56_9BILA|nr:unnamed protein product [Adineta steineri]
MKFTYFLFVFALFSLAIGLVVSNKEVRFGVCDTPCATKGDVITCCKNHPQGHFFDGKCKVVGLVVSAGIRFSFCDKGCSTNQRLLQQCCVRNKFRNGYCDGVRAMCF